MVQVNGAAALSATQLVADRSPEQIVEAALNDPDNTPWLARWCLFSGGHDSTVVAHRCAGLYDGLAHIDTGTALPGVRDFVEAYAAALGRPLVVLEAGDAFRRMVLGTDAWWTAYRSWAVSVELPWRSAQARRAFNDAERRKAGRGLAPQMPMGLLGPAGHSFAYQRLKERQLDALVRDTRRERGARRLRERVALLSGVRVDESQRRKMTTAAVGAYERRGNTVWVNPLYQWSNVAMREYRREHDLPESDVAALLHRSGECNCGAFATPGEREQLRSLWPEWWWSTIAPLEEACEALGLPSRWGERPAGAKVTRGGRLCASCNQLTLEMMT